MMSSFFIMGVASVMWILFGYSLSFSGDHAGIIGTFKNFAMIGTEHGTSAYAPTIPPLVFVAFQMMFALITPALITGSVAGRMNFKALFFFIIFWSILVYYPLAHMVWGSRGFSAPYLVPLILPAAMSYILVPVLVVSYSLLCLVIVTDTINFHIVHTIYLLFCSVLHYYGLDGLDSMQVVHLEQTNLQLMHLSQPIHCCISNDYLDAY